MPLLSTFGITSIALPLRRGPDVASSCMGITSDTLCSANSSAAWRAVDIGAGPDDDTNTVTSERARRRRRSKYAALAPTMMSAAAAAATSTTSAVLLNLDDGESDTVCELCSRG